MSLMKGHFYSAIFENLNAGFGIKKEPPIKIGGP